MIVSLLLALVGSTHCGTFQYRRNFTDPERPVYCSNDLAPLPDFAAAGASVGAARGGPAGSRPFGPLRVVSFNIKFSEQVEEAIEELRANDLADAEILLLQEMDADGVRRIAEALRYNYVYYPAVLHHQSGRQFGDAILARGRILDHEKIILPHLDPNDLQRIAVFALVGIGGGEVGVYSVHLGTRIAPVLRGDQVDAVARHVADRGLARVVVGGDFNTLTDTNLLTAREPLEEIGFVHATAPVEWSYQLRVLGVTLLKPLFDHIFVRGFEVLDAGRAAEAGGASDHWPLWTQIVPVPAKRLPEDYGPPAACPHAVPLPTAPKRNEPTVPEGDGPTLPVPEETGAGQR